MAYRDPDTGRFITEEQWFALQEREEDIFDDDYEDLEDWDQLHEDEVY